MAEQSIYNVDDASFLAKHYQDGFDRGFSKVNETYDNDLLDKVDFVIQKGRLCGSGRDNGDLDVD